MGSKSGANALGIIGAVASFVPGIGTGVRLAIILASTAGSAMIQRRLAKKAKQELLNSMNSLNQQSGQGGFLVEKQGQTYLPLAYGNFRMAGHRSYIAVSDRNDGGTIKTNAYLDIVHSISEGEIQAIDDVLLDNKSLLGSSGTPDPDLYGDPVTTPLYIEIYTSTNPYQIILSADNNSIAYNYLINNVGVGGKIRIYGTDSQNRSYDQYVTVESITFIPIQNVGSSRTVIVVQEQQNDTFVGYTNVTITRLLISGGSGGSSGNIIDTNLGTETQQAFSNLVTNSANSKYVWTNNHRLQGIASTYLRLDASDRQAWRNFPIIEYVGRGKKIYDPRDQQVKYSNKY